jgi:MFS family permease
MPAILRPASLWTRHFTLVFAITFITFFAAFQLFPTAPLRLLELGASVAESGAFLTAFTAGSALGALFTGPLGDRLGQRRMVVGCAIGYGLFLSAYGLLQVRWAFYVLAFPHGVVWSGLLTATMATLGHVLPPARRADGLSIYGLASPGGVIFGPMVGLAVYRHWAFPPIAFSLGLVFVVLGLLSLSLPRDPAHEDRPAAFRMPGLEMLAPCSVLFATALGYGALGTYTAQEALRQGFPPLFGLIPTEAAFLSCMAVGMVAMRIVMTRIGFGRNPNRLLPGMLWASVAGLGLLALLPGGASRHAVSALLYGGGYSMVHTLVNTHVLELTHPSRRGAAFGATLFSFDSGIGLGSFLIGNVIGWGCNRFGLLGFRLGWTVAALLALAAVPLSYRLLRESKASAG